MNKAEEITLQRRIDNFNARVQANLNIGIIDEQSLKQRIKLNEEREKFKILLIMYFPKENISKIESMLVKITKIKSKHL